ncbi:hypothetical protein O3M35_000058 [Rhynocoris fuscipes]|uniref:Uncharacterized protein n=1 Tax=Rhynocoris fuscipes TaxID=488301 RepID=A0AAW1DKE2_9HEMI
MIFHALFRFLHSSNGHHVVKLSDMNKMTPILSLYVHWLQSYNEKTSVFKTSLKVVVGARALITIQQSYTSIKYTVF